MRLPLMLAGYTRSPRMASCSSQGTRHRTHLALGSLTGLAGLLVLDLALSHEHNMLARELLLELTHKSHLVLAEQVLQAVRQEDDDSSSALVDDNFLGTSNVQVLQEWAKLLLFDLLACSEHSNQTCEGG